ncbi:MAG TPA: diacylglycerol kinase family protein [Pyrinomonadaceae bacterium]|nr:diacylglycerol kinase family protein [Pyrinomonadaceae bacterium]
MRESQRLFVVVNNAAARARVAWPRVRGALNHAGIKFESRESSRPGETEETTREALAGGFATVAVVGGDGTLSAAASGYFEPCDRPAAPARPRAINADAALAIIPAGTGDDFARGLAGGRRDTLDAWLARLVNHCRTREESSGVVGAPGDTSHQADSRLVSSTVRSVDVLLGSASGGEHGFVCLNAATIGIGADVAGRVASQGSKMRRLPGNARFAWAALRSLAAQRRVPARVSVDGGCFVECELSLVAVANAPFAGGGMNFAPGASVCDGLLDVVTVCRLSRLGLLRELARVHRGGHLANPEVKLGRGTHVRVETLDEADSLAVEADGDVRGRTPVEFRVMPAALRVVV